MPDREKVKYSIERCISHVPDACRDCAYDAGHPYNECVEMMLKDALALLKEQQPKTGKWIPVTNGRGGHECNQCHDYAPSYQDGDEDLSRFCPCCGAKMEERTE